MGPNSEATFEGSEDRPIYRKVPHDDGWATQLYMIVCDEGWREQIVCQSMYGWAADWLLDVLGHTPYRARLGTCENPKHDSAPQEPHEKNFNCVNWQPLTPVLRLEGP